MPSKGRAPGAPNWGKEPTATPLLLKVVESVRPTGTVGWNLVTSQYNTQAVAVGLSRRTLNGLRNVSTLAHLVFYRLYECSHALVRRDRDTQAW